MPDPDKKMLREIKRLLKKAGNRHRRRQFNKGLIDNPEEAHLDEENLGKHRSDVMNGMDKKEVFVKDSITMTEVNCPNCGMICFIGLFRDGEEKELRCEAGEASCGYHWVEKFKIDEYKK